MFHQIFNWLPSSSFWHTGEFWLGVASCGAFIGILKALRAK